MALMPGLVPTPLGKSVEAAIDILGNRIRVAILGYLQAHGPALRGEIATALGLVPGTVSSQLGVLLEAGVITTDPPAEQIRPGRRVRYVAVPDRIDHLYLRLGQALGVDVDHQPSTAG